MALQYPTNEPTSKIELTVSCKDLPRMDVTSKSDPFVVLFEDGVQVGMTEVIKDNQNPQFQQSFIIKYYFERSQKLSFRVYDCDSFSDINNLSKQELIGEISCEVSDIVGGRGQTTEKPLQGKKAHLGSIKVVAEEVKANATFSFKNDHLPQPLPQTYEEFEARKNEVPQTVPKVDQVVCFSCSASDLDKKDLFGKSDPYIKIYRFREDGGEPAFVYESPVEKKTLNPTWPSFEIPMQKLCNNDMSRTLLFEIWDWDRHSSHDLIGKFQVTLNQILNDNKRDFFVVNPKKLQEKKKYENSGVFHFSKLSLRSEESSEPNPLYNQWIQYRNLLAREYSLKTGTFIPGAPNPFTFLDYLKSGCEISVMFGIDFTASNGDYKDSSSLHHLSGSKPNPYQQAIDAVGRIVAPYDHDQTFPVFGYGARLNGRFPPMFNVNFSDESPDCNGIEGVLEAYKECVPKISFGDMGSAEHPVPGKRYYGDDFHPLIERAVAESKKVPLGSKYFVILLIIDGDYFDDQTTIDKIIDAEDYPVSLIIVGVGGNSFSHCKKFDADDEPLVSSTGRKQARDIVQFVPMNKFKDNLPGLAAEVLAEVPHQLTSFMAAKNISPNRS